MSRPTIEDIRYPADHISQEMANTLPHYAWPGGYQMVYLTKDNSILCPDCANKFDQAVDCSLCEEMDCDNCTNDGCCFEDDKAIAWYHEGEVDPPTYDIICEECQTVISEMDQEWVKELESKGEL